MSSGATTPAETIVVYKPNKNKPNSKISPLLIQDKVKLKIRMDNNMFRNFTFLLVKGNGGLACSVAVVLKELHSIFCL